MQGRPQLVCHVILFVFAARPPLQTGCGAMIFTLFGYLLLVGIVKRDLRSSIVSLAVFVMVRTALTVQSDARRAGLRVGQSVQAGAAASALENQRATRLTRVRCSLICSSCALIPVRRSAVGASARAGPIGQSNGRVVVAAHC